MVATNLIKKISFVFAFCCTSGWGFAQKIDDASLQEYAKANDHHKVGEITANAIGFIRENKEHPFVISVNHTAVHAPLLARDELIQKYNQKLRHTGIEDVHPTYAAMAEMVDESLGMILDELKDLGLTENTVVFLYSDNGGLISDMYLGNPEPMATTMVPLYEGGIRVPLIVEWPGKVKPNSVSNELVNSYDLFSTFVEIGGGKIPDMQETDGISLVPIIKGKKEKLNREALYWHFPTSQWTRNPMGAIRKGNYKLIEHYDDGSLELFDLIDGIGGKKKMVNKKKKKEGGGGRESKKWGAQVTIQFAKKN